ncbi:hypothetical protein [Desulfomicrobium baculatum]|uniref:hypothetical protein n=1 Tax=Desulfomicrobium baculatum TaxID=899 RepID=UPI00019E269D|nr:hypothetical protein [Desulfomicrobium baculatum]
MIFPLTLAHALEKLAQLGRLAHKNIRHSFVSGALPAKILVILEARFVEVTSSAFFRPFET